MSPSEVSNRTDCVGMRSAARTVRTESLRTMPTSLTATTDRSLFARIRKTEQRYKTDRELRVEAGGLVVVRSGQRATIAISIRITKSSYPRRIYYHIVCSICLEDLEDLPPEVGQTFRAKLLAP